MRKSSIVLLALVFAGAAPAQYTVPGAGVPAGTPGYTYGPAQDAAEAAQRARPQGEVRLPVGDSNRSNEAGVIGDDPSARAAEARIPLRDAARPSKRHPPPVEPGTPLIVVY